VEPFRSNLWLSSSPEGRRFFITTIRTFFVLPAGPIKMKPMGGNQATCIRKEDPVPLVHLSSPSLCGRKRLPGSPFFAYYYLKVHFNILQEEKYS
jgi:hypothetical protein